MQTLTHTAPDRRSKQPSSCGITLQLLFFYHDVFYRSTRSFADDAPQYSLLAERFARSLYCKRRTLRRPGNEDNPRSVVHGRSRSVMKRHLAEQKAGCYAKSPLCRSELRYRPSTHTHMQQTVATNKHLSSPTLSSIKITQRQSFLDKPTQSMLSYIHARSRKPYSLSE